jgi:hypothetical protein
VAGSGGPGIFGEVGAERASTVGLDGRGGCGGGVLLDGGLGDVVEGR